MPENGPEIRRIGGKAFAARRLDGAAGAHAEAGRVNLERLAEAALAQDLVGLADTAEQAAGLQGLSRHLGADIEMRVQVAQIHRGVVNAERRLEAAAERQAAHKGQLPAFEVGLLAAALTGAFDGPGISQLQLYALGDGEQYSGVEIAARRADGHATMLILLLD